MLSWSNATISYNFLDLTKLCIPALKRDTAETLSKLFIFQDFKGIGIGISD